MEQLLEMMKVILVAAARGGEPLSAFTYERLHTELGLKLAKIKGCSSFNISADSSAAVEMINNNICPLLELRYTMKSTRAMIAKLVWFDIFHVFRKTQVVGGSPWGMCTQIQSLMRSYQVISLKILLRFAMRIKVVEAKPQMVLIAKTNALRIGDTRPSVIPELQANVFSTNEAKLGSQSCETVEDSDILRAPKILLENGKDVGIGERSEDSSVACSTMLEAIQQAVILAQCLVIEKSTPCAENPRWEMAPFIEAVDAQQFSYFTVEGVNDSSPDAAKRILFAYGVYIPTIPALRKEYGQLLMGCGMIGDALKIFEELELWDDLIHCYCLLEKKAAAVELIKARLCEMPNDPRLWCSFGDVTNNDAHYEKALEVSNNRSARAKRSLARSAYNKGNYEVSKVLWEAAMALNSLHPDGWFALGAAALKARDIEKALEGFTRAVQLDPDNGEAWNNIACLCEGEMRMRGKGDERPGFGGKKVEVARGGTCVQRRGHMMKKRNKEAFIAFKEALKFRRNSWQLWENYSQVAADIGNFGQALEASMKVLDMTKNKRLDTEILEKIMKELEARTSGHNPHVANGDSFYYPADESRNTESGFERSRETDMLVELLRKVLNQIVRSGGGGGEVWGLYSRWHKIKGDLTMCSEALLKQVRSYQGAELWNNKDRFNKFANASLQLCQVYLELSSSSGNRRELNAAEMHLRNTVKLVRYLISDIDEILFLAVNFSDTQELKDLQACLDEVNKRLQVT
ncbi:hypothetical protein GIB67_030881 [Kingdonia uniflora]|uniref:Uncharacterized protein n=1 Tax=Kingdonia uniflora TaxID=39325 RepID=A0A7J7L3G3_9MAGN|nr:hypothetical protein GIB67_030881 [Kingdonia uniflora]